VQAQLSPVRAGGAWAAARVAGSRRGCGSTHGDHRRRPDRPRPGHRV